MVIIHGIPSPPLSQLLDHPFYPAEDFVLLLFTALRPTFSTSYYIQIGNGLHRAKEGAVSLIQAVASISLSLITRSKRLCPWES